MNPHNPMTTFDLGAYGIIRVAGGITKFVDKHPWERNHGHNIRLA